MELSSFEPGADQAQEVTGSTELTLTDGLRVLSEPVPFTQVPRPLAFWIVATGPWDLDKRRLGGRVRAGAGAG